MYFNKYLIVVICTTFTLPHEINGKKILVVQFFGSKSHVISYLGLLEELSNRGHEVTLIAPVKGFTKSGNIKEISTEEENKFFGQGSINFFERKEKNIASNPFAFMTKFGVPSCNSVNDRPDIKALISDSTWDLVILQPLFNECALGFVYKIMQRNKCPLILFSPNVGSNLLVSPLGGYFPVSTIPSPYSNAREMNLLERIQNIATELYIIYWANYKFTPAMEAVYREKLGADIPSAKEILSFASIMLSNEHFSFATPKPNYPDIIEIGGINSHPPKPLPKDIEEFLSQSGNDGVIIFSFGSVLQMNKMSDSKREIFLNVFKKLKQNIIWRYDGNEIKNLPSNIKLIKWLPQQDILGHPKTKLFITHCGIGGIEEAIFHTVPMIGIPFFGDQIRNAIHAENQGILINNDWNELTEDKLENSIKEILNNSSYKETITQLSLLLKDQINRPLDRAVWWTEYVMRHRGIPQLKSSSRNMNFIQYHSLDVFTIFITLLISIVLIFIKTLKMLYKIIFSMFKQNNVKFVDVSRKKK